jgi:NAD(P)-dependent dehydrogenase (short-subunit alcohol dehydrogenase family)
MTESDDPFAAALFERYPDLVIPTGINLMRTDGFIDPVDVSNAMVWLASDEARFVTGIQLPVDAGYSTKP